MVEITAVEEDSYAFRAGLQKGDKVLSINGREVCDVLDYRFLIQSKKLLLRYVRKGAEAEVHIRKSREEADIGLGFANYLMDNQHSCRNRCIFCFVDQMPKGLRDTLYFKDDDSRMSFLFGSYITLTGLSEHEIERIIELHICPINISVHTMNPALRIKMMGNVHAGESLHILDRFSDAGIEMNTQLVLCPGINDGGELRFSLEELSKHTPFIRSIALVPVGLTKYREGLPQLKGYDREGAQKVLSIVDEFNAHFAYYNHGRVIAFASDEFYLLAGQKLPSAESYGDYAQLENGVGLCALLKDGFLKALSEVRDTPKPHTVSIATGEAAFGLISELAKLAEKAFLQVKINVYEIKNDFFGRSVTVAGLLTGQDLSKQLSGKELGKRLLIPRVSLRNEGDRFLDDHTPEELKKILGVEVEAVPNDGAVLLNKMLEE